MTEPVVDVGPVAHGGHCVARLDGQVVFVRHTLPGERVRIRITERSKRFLRADAVEVIDAAPDRVDAPVPAMRATAAAATSSTSLPPASDGCSRPSCASSSTGWPA